MPSIVPSQSPFAIHWALYPRTYLAPYSPGIAVIDGDLTKDEWSQVPWSDEFDDIRGAEDAPSDERPRPACRTRMKMMWDDQYLYIGALLPSDFTTVATYTERNSPIFQQDSDFEVFVDPPGSCHNYKEFEVNALNTVWNLLLDRPYNDGGAEHSGRIAKPGDDLYYDVKHQKSATRVIDGQLNDPIGGATYSVEIAMAHSDVLARIPGSAPPSIGTRWRINFSRVEKRGDINWTWQPQIAWDAVSHRFGGHVNMHLPDAWGYLVFGGPEKSMNEPVARDPTWPPRLAAMNVYYAQRQYRQENGLYATRLDMLTPLLHQAIVSPFQIEILSNDLPNKPFYTRQDPEPEFIVVVRGNPDGTVITVTNNRLMQVHWSKSNVNVE
jgi:Carbohydrate family 9 binding domain-like